jgi:hypothetical protein
MSTARDLANFLTGVTAPDLPAQALDHAAMLIASTLASRSFLTDPKCASRAFFRAGPSPGTALSSARSEGARSTLARDVGVAGPA